MWSTKLQHISSEPAQSAPGGSDQEELSDNLLPGLPHPIPVSEDGTLELDLGMCALKEKVAPAPLQSRAFSQAPNTIQRVDDGCRMKTVNMYVNQHGQKVKLAQLAPAPSTYSNPTVRKTLAVNQESSREKKKVVRDGDILNVPSNNNNRKSGVHSKNASLDAFVTKRCIGKRTSSEVSCTSGMLNGSDTQRVLGLDRSALNLPAIKTNTLKTLREPSIEVKNHQNARLHPAINGAELDPTEEVDPNHPSVVKEELNQGLKKIMEDLAALDIPQISNSLFLDNNDPVLIKKSTSTMGEVVDSDHGKENDSPSQFTSINCDNDTDPNNHKDAAAKRPPIANRHSRKSSHHCANPIKINKFDSKKSSTSSLNSAHKSVDSSDIRMNRPAERQKSYDPVKAREYIRQQKQDRLNRLKAEREQQQADMQARKQKLDELSRTSLKLVKASIKRRPNIGNNEDRSGGPEDFSSTNYGPTGGEEIPNHPERSNLKPSSSDNLNHNSADQYSFSNIPAPLSHDDSSAQLIKDICEMKNKIEAIAKTLRSTVTAKGPNINQPASSTRGNAVPSSLSKGCSTHTIIENSVVKSQTESTGQEPYLHNLTSNLKKIRESLQCALTKNETKSSTSSGTCKIPTVQSGHQRHRRFSSAGSDSAFEAIKYEVYDGRAPSLDGHLSSTLQKRRITTSFPTLPIVETQNIIFDRDRHQGTDSESGNNFAGDCGTSAPAMSVPMHQERNSDSCGTEKGRGTSCNKDQSPEWFEPITSRPYPINFISVVKRKLGSSIKGEHSDNLIDGTVKSNNSTSAVRQNFVFPEHFSKHSSKDINLELPPFVTARNSVCSELSSAAWTSAQPSTLPAPKPLSAITDQHGSNLKERTLKNDINGLSFRSSILDALNLEEMQVEFARALNPSTLSSSDLTPAEKPLSAPNTPAKTSLKLARPVSLGKTGKLNFIGQSKDTNKSEDSNELVPPNVSLATGRIEKKSGSADSWISHSRGYGESASTNQEDESSVANPESLSSKDTFEIGQIFNPTALHLQFQAELNILDSFNESLCQVMEVEKVRAVALARHQALYEIQPVAILTEDKATDVQTSLLKSTSQVSSINYQRGSKDPCDVSVLDVRTSECASAVGALSNDTYSSKDGHLSPLSTAASDTLASSTKDKISNEPILSNADEKNGSQLDTSVEKSISEDIFTMSDTVPEEVTSKLDENNTTGRVDLEGDSRIAENSDISSCVNVSKANGMANTLDQSLSLDMSVDSKGDSTNPGDALIVDSLNCSDKHLFPTLVTGEDMFQFNLQMLEQLMHEEELRVQHRNTLLKLRVKVLGEMARTEVAALDLDKKKLREKGDDGHKDQMTALRKKQRGIMLRFQQQREEIERIRRTEELAWQERRLMYLQQMHLIRMQISTHVMLHKFEKCGGNVSKKSRVIVKSIQDNKSQRITVKSLVPESSNAPAEVPSALAVTQSSSVSMASIASEGSKSSAISNSSHRGNSMVPGVTSTGDNLGAAGDSESSHLEERVLRGLHELESRCRNFKEREKVLHERRQSVEQIIQWRRKLEEEERRLREVERQAQTRHRNTLAKHASRDRSTSPFQFLENGAQGHTMTASSGSLSRSIQDLPRNSRSNVNTTASPSGSASVTEDVDSSIPEEIGDTITKPSGESTIDGATADQYANESFESEVSEVKTQESLSTVPDGSQSSNHKEMPVQLPSKIDSDYEARLPKMSERTNKYPGVTIKVPLSPRLQRVQRRRYSSGSDDSVILSQTETGSEQSDIEGRISALSEQLHQCKAEAERLRREAKRTRNERLIAKEQSLHKQLQAYESYICQLRRNLEAELRQSSVPIVRPQIKQPRVSPGKVASRRQDADVISTPGSDRSISQAASPETASTSLHREEIDSEPKEVETVSEAVSTVVSEGASEIASEVPSDVASEGASEVSENSSLLSQDAPSLVANKSSQENPSIDQKSFLSEGERNSAAIIKEQECKGVILSTVKLEESGEISPQNAVDDSDGDDTHRSSNLVEAITPSLQELEASVDISIVSQSVHQTPKETTCSLQEVSLSSFPVEGGDAGNTNAEKPQNKDDITISVDQVKSLSSEEEIDELSETIEDDHVDFAESRYDSNVIQVFLREKEKETPHSPLMIGTDLESGSPSSKIGKSAEEIVDTITNDLLQDLLGECLRTATPSHTASKDAYWSKVVNTSLHEATSDILSIYEKRLHKAANQQTDVRKRISEILAETQASSPLRAEGRIRDIMTTAYGVLSPEDSPCGSPNLSSSPIQQSAANITNEDNDTTYNKMAEASAMKSNVGKASDPQVGLIGENVVDSDGVSQEWFDEDFGLTRRKQEAEELHRQQLLIEQEIEQLQQQKAQGQEQIPYYYVREIPNKPPPPYTPPGQAPRVLSSSTSLTSPVEEVRAVCTDRPVILKAVNNAVDLLYEARCQGLDLQNQEAPNSYLEAGFGLPHQSHLSDQELSVHKNSAKVYRSFLFDLAKELVISAYSCEAEDPSPPWLRPDNWVRRRKALTVVPKTKEMLHEIISRQVLVLFGFVPKASKENLTIRWSRKKRDHVDELLVRESQEEERQWTNYEQDEAVVKNNVAMAILDSLLDDTVQVLRDVFRRREQRHCPVF